MVVARLIRRFVWCAVVGLTAFGVAGWMLRPKPLWVVDCSGWPGKPRLVETDRALTPDEPVWIRCETDHQNETGDTVVALDPHAGAELHRWPITYPESCHPLFVGGDGRIAAICSGVGTMRWRVFDGRSGQIVEREDSNPWEMGGVGTSAWRLERRPDGYRLHVFDLWSGSIKTHDLKSSNGRLLGRERFAGLSPNGRRLVTAASRRKDAKGYEFIQVWDVEDAEFVDQISSPAPASSDDSAIQAVKWLDAGSQLELKVCFWAGTVQSNSEWVYDLSRRRLTEHECRPSNIYRVPGSEASIRIGETPTLAALAPDALLPYLGDAYERSVHWSVGERKPNRNVGCHGYFGDPQVRSNCLIVVCETPLRAFTVECWPLPPRDPRKPAAATALSSFLAAWAVMSWRARRPRPAPTLTSA